MKATRRSFAERRFERRQRALAYAQARQECSSWAEVARRFGLTPQAVGKTMSNACPDFGSLNMPAPWVVRAMERDRRRQIENAALEAETRPLWSIPDKWTLQIAAEARAEIEAGERANREAGRLPSPAWSYPDAITRAIAAEARAEIEAATA